MLIIYSSLEIFCYAFLKTHVIYLMILQNDDRPTSNPLPPQSVASASYDSERHVTAQELLQGVALQVPNFGTEQVIL